MTTDTIFKIEDRKITGDVQTNRRSTLPEQHTPQQFLAALDALFEAAPEIEAVRWSQGTPSFNDGEPCEFNVHEPRWRLAGTDEDSEDGEYEDGFTEDLYSYGKHTKYEDRPKHPGYGLRSNDPKIVEYNAAYAAYSKKMYADDNIVPHIKGERGDAVVEATNAFAKNWGSYEFVFSDTFGDPAEITATREGFNVEYYEVGY